MFKLTWLHSTCLEALPFPASSSLPYTAAGDDPQHVCVVGEGTLALWRLDDGHTLRPLHSHLGKREGAQYCCVAWAADNDAEALLLVGTRRGEVLVVGEGEVRQVLALDGGGAAEALAAHAKVGARCARCGCACWVCRACWPGEPASQHAVCHA